MFNTIDLMRLNGKYQKYRSNLTMASKSKKWWTFAYNAIAETQIRPKLKQFKWGNIKLITQTRRNYIDLLVKKKTNSGKLSSVEMEREKVFILNKFYKLRLIPINTTFLRCVRRF